MDYGNGVIRMGRFSDVECKKTNEKDGYEAVQLGFGDMKVSRVNKPMKGQFAKAGVSCKRYIREFKLEGEYALGNRGVDISDDISIDFKVTTTAGTKRLARAAFEHAKANGNKNVTIVTKANIMKILD